MVRVILDASFVISCVDARVDLLSELQRVFGNVDVCMPVCVFEEVERNGSKLCISILESMKPKLLVATSIQGDDALVETARKGDIVATMDKELKERLREKGVRLVTLRQKKYVEEV